MEPQLIQVDEQYYCKYPDSTPPWFIADRIYPLVRVPDHFLDCVVFIGVYERDIFTPHGTGFLAVIEQSGLRFQHVITARHIIEGISGDTVYLRVNLVAGGSEIVPTKKEGWIRADDPTDRLIIDIAATHTNLEASKYKVLNVNIEGDLLTPDLIEKTDFGIGDEVFYMGLHTSHHGEEKNVPVVRMGTLAAVSDEPYKTDHGYIEGVLVESRSIGGTSGSPVFASIPPWKVINGDVQQMDTKHAYFFGMVAGIWVTDNPTDGFYEQIGASVARIVTGISIVISGQDIVGLLRHSYLQQQRAKIVDAKRKEAGKNFSFSSAKPQPKKEAEVFPTGDDILKAALSMPPKPHKGGVA